MVDLGDHDSVPPIGLGTWQNDDPDQCETTVKNALEMGYRHLDTAQLYENEAAVGEGIVAASVPRDEIFLASKVDFNNLLPDEVIQSTEQSLDRLGVDTIDLMYVHWPAGEYEAEETLSALETLKKDGKIRHIGVSNFTPELLREALEVMNEPIYAHQVEMHPLLPQNELRALGLKHDIKTVAYSPFRHGTIFNDPTVKQVAEQNGVTPAQVSLAWLLEKKAYPIPKATGEPHLRQNFGALELSLSDGDVEQIDSIDRTDRYIDPPFAPW